MASIVIGEFRNLIYPEKHCDTKPTNNQQQMTHPSKVLT